MSPKPIFSNSLKSDTRPYSPSVENSVCPYIGLKSFENNGNDQNFFFGRDTLTHQLLNHLHERNFLALVGALGTGKSSLLRAGLLHHLEASEQWDVKLMQPSQHPLKTLAMAFVDNHLSTLQKAEKIVDIQFCLEQSPDGFSNFLNKVSTPKLLLAIDNFEEIFTLCHNSQERWHFLTALLTALEKHPHQLKIIIIINEEFLSYFLEQKPKELGQKIQDNFIFISPLNYQERYDAITLPAQEANLELESQLVDQLLKDTQNLHENLPLLQYSLWQIFRLHKNFRLTLGSYKQLGNVSKILDQQGNQTFYQLSRTQQKTAKKLFLSLIKTHEEMGNICHLVPQRKLENLPDFPFVFNQFKQAGFIQTEQRDNLANQENFLRLSHPIIIKHWLLLKQWLEQRHYYVNQQKNLEETAQKWQTSQRNTQYLLTSKRLKIVKSLRKNKSNFAPLTEEFVRKSYQKQSRKTFLYAILPLSLIVSLGAFAYRHWDIKNAWQTLKVVTNNPYDSRRKDALETLKFWRINFKQVPLTATSLKDINLSKTNLSNMDFSGTNLENANLFKSDLNNSNFKNANLSNSYLVKSNLSQSNLRLTNLVQANLSKANLFQSNLTFASLNFANLSSANLSQSSLSFANIEEANLSQTNVSFSNLSGANLSFSNLMFADLSDSNLSSANLVEANLLSANLTNTNLLGTNLIQAKNLEPSNLKQACFWQYAIYKGQWNNEQQEWEIDEPANREFIEKLMKDKTSDPKIKPSC
ncbi:nSTAND1 domain-containing NTPase [Crocosphaera sp.]|uniref:nSTAND1 domain-containing NTPase n=1 Tax=Crocosphaera sp. TaxID=2729996 RepID=UPI003F231709|nr:pentapeptide repeat-containing protein [Crocosphaera sp.]